MQDHEVVWMNPAEIPQSEIRHPPYTGPLLNDIKRIKEIFAQVCPKSLDEWQDGFRRDRNPESEIALWLRMGELFLERTADVPPERHREIFNDILNASFGI